MVVLVFIYETGARMKPLPNSMLSRKCPGLAKRVGSAQTRFRYYLEFGITNSLTSYLNFNNF